MFLDNLSINTQDYVPSFRSDRHIHVASFLAEHVDYSSRPTKREFTEGYVNWFTPVPGGAGFRSKIEEIVEVWEHIYGEALEGHFCLAYGRRPHTVKSGETKPRLEGFRQFFFSWHEDGEKAAGEALRLSNEGYTVYHCAHLLSREDRKAAFATAIRCLWADGDGARIPEGFPSPTLTIESSPGHYHYYWRLDSVIEPEEAKELNDQIARVIGADPAGCDLSQLLRVPHTNNYDYSVGPTTVKIKEWC